jgi:hypothetical protein
MTDSNAVIRSYLAANAGLVALVGARIFSPRLPENCALPALGFFTRGGVNNPHIEPLLLPSKQFDCWGSSPIIARQVYRGLYDALQGIQNIKVTIAGTDYYILSAIEEVQGQDLQDEVQGYFRVLTFFQIMVR